jgi:ketol-acid reductoisomerase
MQARAIPAKDAGNRGWGVAAMADEMPRADEVQNLTPEEVAQGLVEGRWSAIPTR